MCRFLLFKSKQPVNPQLIVKSFAIMAKESRAFDGDWQGDGWGISWLDKSGVWQNYRSTKPIWQDVQSINRLYKTATFAVHARSASFPQHKNNIEYNQPYSAGKYIFVFNGLLKGVSLPLPGTIGSQKIWYLLQKKLLNKSPKNALIKIKEILLKKTRDVQALNIGLVDKNNIYALCYYSNHPQYYRLHFINNPDYKIICSAKLPGYNFKSLHTDNVIKL